MQRERTHRGVTTNMDLKQQKEINQLKLYKGFESSQAYCVVFCRYLINMSLNKCLLIVNVVCNKQFKTRFALDKNNACVDTALLAVRYIFVLCVDQLA